MSKHFKEVFELDIEDMAAMPRWAKSLNEVAERVRYAAFYYRTMYAALKTAMHETLVVSGYDIAAYDRIVKLAASLTDGESRLCAPDLNGANEAFVALLTGNLRFKDTEKGKEVIEMACKKCAAKKPAAKKPAAKKVAAKKPVAKKCGKKCK